MRRPWQIFFGCFLVSCGSGSQEIASKNRTFYDWPAASGASTTDGYEKAWPPLDLGGQPPQMEYRGVTIVRGGVHLSRPTDWRIREASNEPGRAFIQYISPRAYSFAIYERSDSPDDPWRDVLGRYENDVSQVGAKIAAPAVPVATWLGQGRAYSVERKIEGAKRPFVGYSREYLLRSGHRIVLVQIMRQREPLGVLDDELMRVIATLEVL